MNETEQNTKTAGLGAEMPAGPEQSATDAGQGAGMPAGLDQSATDAAQGAGIATDAGQGAGMPASPDQSATDAAQGAGMPAGGKVEIEYMANDPIKEILPDQSISDEGARLDDFVNRLYEGTNIKGVKLEDESVQVQAFMLAIHLFDRKNNKFIFSESLLKNKFGDVVVEVFKKCVGGGQYVEDEGEEEQLELGLFPDEPEERKKERRKKSEGKRIFYPSPSGNHIMATTKIAQEIEKLKEGTWENFDVGPKKKNKKAIVSASIALDGEKYKDLAKRLDLPEGLVISSNISHFDVMVENAVARLYDRSYRRINAKMIYKEMTGYSGGSSSIGAAMLKKIEDVMFRLKFTQIAINYTQQERLRNPKDKGEHFIIDEIIDAGIDVSVDSKTGAVSEIWFLLKERPLISEYSQRVNQIFTYQYKMLDIPGMNHTEETISLIHILLNQYAICERKGTSKIDIDTLFEKMGMELTTDKKYHFVKNCEKIFSAWKEGGYILKFEEKKEGKKLLGYIIYSSHRRLIK